MTILFLYALGNIRNIYPQPFDIDKFSFVFSFLTTVLFGIFKYNCIFWNQERFSQILKSLKQTYTKFECEKYQANERLRKFKIFIRCYIAYMIPPMIFTFQIPLTEFNKSGKKILPFFFEYPFDTSQNNLLFVLALLIIFSSCLLHAFILITSDHLIYGTINVFSLEFNILKTEFRELKFKNENDWKINLKILIESHNKLIENIKEFQSIFASILFYNFGLGSFFLCFTALKCSSVESIPNALLSFGFCIYSLFQIFMQCFFGQMLTDASENLYQEIYQCGWENLKDIKLRKDLVLILVRSRRIVELKVLNIWGINIEQFFNIVRNGYSYFTLFRELLL
ncbi:hypothetical protein PVAND_015654 [Polypedilum vanderplanki]|uniref:Odorant receptor n=1 Tax=Polypedilum vanderplanki TaxID=319348 RepID=A0A9J6BDA3_POLVA|nr:hypothetical protein PVAND_015654 [Polypedilum vanderplanki]